MDWDGPSTTANGIGCVLAGGVIGLRIREALPSETGRVSLDSPKRRRPSSNFKPSRQSSGPPHGLCL